MQRFWFVLRSLLLVLLLSASVTAAFAHPHIVRANDGIEIPPAVMLQDLSLAQVIFIGELHDNDGHHRMQLSVIRALHELPQPLAIGLEMFRSNNQFYLDRWVSGDYERDSFIRIFLNNWSMWDKYQELFDYAKAQNIKLVGLNIPREISGKVARQGFAALPASEREALGNVQCVVNPEYADLIKKALGGHGGHGQQFLFFCEAQMLWDSMMARHLADFLKSNPEYRVVVLSGSAHAWKFGIPRQLLRQMAIEYRVILPEISGRVSRDQIRGEETDYLWLDEGPDGWTF